MKFTDQHIKDWREQGFTIIEDFFSADEIAPVVAEYERIYGLPGREPSASKEPSANKEPSASREPSADREPSANREPSAESEPQELREIQKELNLKEDGGVGEFRTDQFKNIDQFPYDGSAALNLLSLHPKLIELAEALLDVPAVHMYQSHTWAKYTGEADYDQTFHCDFGNHTLLVPSDDISLRTVDFIVYLTDVTDAHGALHYVTKPDSDAVLREGAVHAPDEIQKQLLEHQRSAAGPSGTLVAHGIDTFHRGTNLTQPNGHRFTMTVGYKASGNDMIGYHVWQQAEGRPWENVFGQATPQQLQCLGIPKPGHSYWNNRTLKLTQSRWPNWDMTEYFEAAGVS